MSRMPKKGYSGGRLLALGLAEAIARVNIKTEIGRGALSRFGEDSRFSSDLQFTLDRKGVDWIDIPNRESKHETLLNRKAITSVQTLKDGDVLGVGSEAEKINKLPLKVRIKRLS